MILIEMLRQSLLENGQLRSRKLPSNRDVPAYCETPKDLSPTATRLWNDRKYGAFAASILGDPDIKIAIDDLTGQERNLLSHCLVGAMASEDLPLIQQLPDDHPKRIAYSAIFWRESREVSRITISMESELADRIGREAAVDLVGDIAAVLAEAAKDAKRIFFRTTTSEFSQDSRDSLIARQLGMRIQQLKRAKEEAFRDAE